MLERERDVGGTWNANRYPGCQCDVPSNLYCYSFAPHPGWTRTFSEREEIWSYLRDCADRYGLRPHLRLGTEVAEVVWEARAPLAPGHERSPAARAHRDRCDGCALGAGAAVA